MFKFSFNTDIEDNIETSKDIIKEENKCISEEIIPTSIQIESFTELTSNSNSILVGKLGISYINPYSVVGKVSTEISNAEIKHSDLEPGKYEGGLKIWECTLDLLEFLNNNKLNNETNLSFLNTLKGKLVLDLGCGSGILGILCLHFGAIVHFQDYNKDVITNFTNPNVILNFEDDITEILKKCKFYSGDWESFDKLTDTKFDIILTSETIYNPLNYEKLINIFKNKLKPDGVVYLAAKTYYFGVGGGTRLFEKCILDNKCLTSKIVWNCSEGIQREIMEIKLNHVRI